MTVTNKETVSAKLRELLEAASPGPWRFVNITQDNVKDGAVVGPNGVHVLGCNGDRFREDGKLAATAPVLARLVVDLSEALERHSDMCSGLGGCPLCAAHAAVEKLEL